MHSHFAWADQTHAGSTAKRTIQQLTRNSLYNNHITQLVESLAKILDEELAMTTIASVSLSREARSIDRK